MEQGAWPVFWRVGSRCFRPVSGNQARSLAREKGRQPDGVIKGESVVPSSKRISEGKILAGLQKGADQGAIRQSDYEKPK